VLVVDLYYTLAFDDGIAHLIFLFHLALFGLSGGILVFIAVKNIRLSRTADDWLLFLWLAGTLFFSFYINWTTNARILLPLFPVIGIAVIRHLELHWIHISRNSKAWAIFASAAMAIAVVFMDYQWSHQIRQFATNIQNSYPRERIFFQGTWGLQYYLRQAGAEKVTGDNYLQGGIVIKPLNNSNAYFSIRQAELVETLEYTQWGATNNNRKNAGFYSDDIGFLPYYLGKASDQYMIFRVAK
jgi:hypothetical protein